MRRTRDRVGTVAFAVAVVLLIFSVSIALPIYIRPFYYAHIEPLGLAEKTGRSAEDIRAAYDELMDYLTVPGHEFGTGSFAYSEEGRSHFADCRALFMLDGIVLVVSLLTVTVIGVLVRRKKMTLCRPFGKHVLLCCGATVLSLVGTLAALISIDFDRAFDVFHYVLFPGKDNWSFDGRYDEIIYALPQRFFMNCAILIGASILILSIGCIVYGAVKRKARE